MTTSPRFTPLQSISTVLPFQAKPRDIGEDRAGTPDGLRRIPTRRTIDLPACMRMSGTQQNGAIQQWRQTTDLARFDKWLTPVYSGPHKALIHATHPHPITLSEHMRIEVK
jgi:hypothetical protein